MNAASGRVLVLGGDTRSFLAVVRSLGRSGLEVHTAWCRVNSPSLKSRYIKQSHVVPEYRSDDLEWVDAFNAVLRAERFELVLPCTDATILPLQQHRHQLDQDTRIYLLPDDVYRICSDKAETYSLAERIGVPLPAQTVASNLDDVRSAADRFGFPLVLKPPVSASSVNPLRRQAVRKVARSDELRTVAEMLVGNSSILVQQNFIGKGVGVEVLCNNGEILTAFQHERVHEPMLGGGSSYRRSVPLHKGMLDATTRLMKALCYTGVAMVEFKIDPKSGRWVLIEINGRFWGSLHLSISAGLDFPRYLYEMLCLGRTNFPREYRENIYARHWSHDLEWMIRNAVADRRNPELLTVPLVRVASEFVNVLRLRERSDTFVVDDPFPAFADLGELLDRFVFRVTMRTPMLRRRERRRVVNALHNARNILFVCYGNICRSPFAAALLEKFDRPGIVGSSAGYFPQAQRRPPDAAISAARQYGVDLSTHRSVVMTTAAATSADAILVFDRDNLEGVTARFPQIRSKVFFVGALDSTGDLEIEDPYGGSGAVFDECYKRIEQILRTVFVSKPTP